MKKTPLRALILALALTAVLCLPALAAQQVRLNGDSYIRTGPGRGYDPLGVAYKGSVLTYLGETQYDERPVAWYKVSFKDTTGWVSSKYTSLVGEPDPAPDTSWGQEGWGTGASSGGTGWGQGSPSAPAAGQPGPASGSFFGAPGPNVAGDVTEVFDFFLAPLEDTAAALGLDNYAYVVSEVPDQFYNDGLRIGGWQVAEMFIVTGPGYSLFGVTVGMDPLTARQTAVAHGLDFYDENGDTLSFQHPTTLGVDVDGHDGIVYVTIADGAVSQIEWYPYTG